MLLKVIWKSVHICWKKKFEIEFQKVKSLFWNFCGCTFALVLQTVLSELSLQHPLFRDLPTQLRAWESHDFCQCCLAALIWNSETLKLQNRCSEENKTKSDPWRQGHLLLTYCLLSAEVQSNHMSGLWPVGKLGWTIQPHPERPGPPTMPF